MTKASKKLRQHHIHLCHLKIDALLPIAQTEKHVPFAHQNPEHFHRAVLVHEIVAVEAKRASRELKQELQA